MLERGVTVSYETVRRWCAKFGQQYASALRRRQPRPADTWHLDEVFIKINGEQKYLWRAVDQDGNVLDILGQDRRDKAAARRFLRTLLKKIRTVPRVILTDKLRSYPADHAVRRPGRGSGHGRRQRRADLAPAGRRLSPDEHRRHRLGTAPGRPGRWTRRLRRRTGVGQFPVRRTRRAARPRLRRPGPARTGAAGLRGDRPPDPVARQGRRRQPPEAGPEQLAGRAGRGDSREPEPGRRTGAGTPAGHRHHRGGPPAARSR
jgi:transposase-like protein